VKEPHAALLHHHWPPPRARQLNRERAYEAVSGVRRRAHNDRVRFESSATRTRSEWGAIYGDQVHVHADHRSEVRCERWMVDAGRDQPGSSAARKPCRVGGRPQ
jgi:hypothetical protein